MINLDYYCIKTLPKPDNNGGKYQEGVVGYCYFRDNKKLEVDLIDHITPESLLTNEYEDCLKTILMRMQDRYNYLNYEIVPVKEFYQDYFEWKLTT